MLNFYRSIGRLIHIIHRKQVNMTLLTCAAGSEKVVIISAFILCFLILRVILYTLSSQQGYNWWLRCWTQKFMLILSGLQFGETLCICEWTLAQHYIVVGLVCYYWSSGWNLFIPPASFQIPVFERLCSAVEHRRWLLSGILAMAANYGH